MNIEQDTSSSYHHQSNGQVEVCMKFVKHSMKKCIENNDDIHIAYVTDESNAIGAWAAKTTYVAI